MAEITQILTAIDNGDPHAASELLPLVYNELRQLAMARLAGERPGQTLQATALVHEAYLRLVTPANGNAVESNGAWNSRGHFFAAAANAMRRILIDAARRKKRQRHGGDWQRVELADCPDTMDDEELLALDDALVRLAKEDPIAAQVIELHHFAGLSHEQVAATLGVTVYQARQKWTYARAWLTDALGGD
jgi:RNA polymerase sigma factor (TIGR02999 family)